MSNHHREEQTEKRNHLKLNQIEQTSNREKKSNRRANRERRNKIEKPIEKEKEIKQKNK